MIAITIIVFTFVSGGSSGIIHTIFFGFHLIGSVGSCPRSFDPLTVLLSLELVLSVRRLLISALDDLKNGKRSFRNKKRENKRNII